VNTIQWLFVQGDTMVNEPQSLGTFGIKRFGHVYHKAMVTQLAVVQNSFASTISQYHIWH
jgi:hypothetical protein